MLQLGLCHAPARSDLPYTPPIACTVATANDWRALFFQAAKVVFVFVVYVFCLAAHLWHCVGVASTCAVHVVPISIYFSCSFCAPPHPADTRFALI